MEEDDRPHFRIDLQTPTGIETGMGSLPFASLEAVCCDVLAAIPETAAELLRSGVDPMRCTYLVRDAGGVLLVELPFSELVRDRLPPSPPIVVDFGRPPVDDLLARAAALRARSQEAQDRAFETSERWRSALTSYRANLPT